MRDLKPAELGFVYGAAGSSKHKMAKHRKMNHGKGTHHRGKGSDTGHHKGKCSS